MAVISGNLDIISSVGLHGCIISFLGLHGCFISYIGLHGSIFSSIGPYGCIICRTIMVEVCTYVALIVFSVK